MSVIKPIFWVILFSILAIILIINSGQEYKTRINFHYASGGFKLSEQSFSELRGEGISEQVITKLQALKNKEFKSKENLMAAVNELLSPEESISYESQIWTHIYEYYFTTPTSLVMLCSAAVGVLLMLPYLGLREIHYRRIIRRVQKENRTLNQNIAQLQNLPIEDTSDDIFQE